jgi:PAS domain S-box-containing protein
MESRRPPIDAAEELLALQGVSHDYGSLEVVRGVTLTVHHSEIHALVGQHGTGKTTLAMMVSGMLRPRTGTIVVRGRRYASLSLPIGHRLGIRMVYQHLSLNDNFTVAETLFSDDPRVNNFAWNSPRRVNRAAAEFLDSHGFDIAPGARLRSLSLSDRAVVDILKQLHARPALLILDEALEKLTPPALSRIVPMLLRRAEEGMGILFITHRIDDVYSFAHRVSIMREGELIFTGPTEDIDQMNLVRLAYTQSSAQPAAAPAQAEFTRFLRYNEAILEHLPLSLLVTDIAGRVKLVNEHFQNAFGLSAGECLDRALPQLLPEVSEAEHALLAGSLQRGEEREFFNVTMRVRERTTLHNLRTLPVLDRGQHIGSILLMEDITDYDRMQKKVLLTEKLASVGLLAAGVAHEINNPLEIIYNYLAALRRRVHTPDAQETVSRLGEEISYIATIVSNLVNLADTNRIEREEIDLNDVIARILDLLRESAKSRRIRIAFRPGSPEVRAAVNANEMKQVILNLMKNGFEAMPDGGAITVATEEAIVDGVATALVHVEDDGPGISAANPNDVFLPFYTTKKSQGENMGLGLSVSYAILERYGGRLSAENLPGRGSRFTIALPLAPQGEPATEEETAPPGRG